MHLTSGAFESQACSPLSPGRMPWLALALTLAVALALGPGQCLSGRARHGNREKSHCPTALPVMGGRGRRVDRDVNDKVSE